MPDASPALTARQQMIVAATGAILWFAAAMLIRVIGPIGAFEGANRIWLYALVVPGTVPFVPLVRRSAGLGPHQHGAAMALGTGVATLLDGIALAWFPWIYADTVDLVAAAGAVILWGAGVGIILGIVFDRRA